MCVDPHRIALDLEHAVWRAVVQKNGEALGDLFADDYVEITLDGKRSEKTGVVTQSPQIDEITGYRIDSEKVIVIDDDCLILTYHLLLDGTCRGIDIAPRDRWATSVWSRQGDAWRCRLFQQSRFAEAAAT